MSYYQLLFRLLDWLRSDASDVRFSLAVCLGFSLALVPAFTLHGALLWALVLVLRVNACAIAGSFLFFTVLASPFDTLFHKLGYAILTPSWLHRLWAGLYHMAIAPYTRFNNTLVMGRSVFALLAVVPLYFAVKQLLHRHRNDFVGWIQQSPAWDSWASSRLYRLYVSYHQTAR